MMTALSRVEVRLEAERCSGVAVPITLAVTVLTSISAGAGKGYADLGLER